MASSYTSSYQLCQWEAGDKVLRTDFNGDNQKIDAALAGLAEELEEGFAGHAATLSGHTATLSQHAQQLEEIEEKATAKLLLSGTVSGNTSTSHTIPMSGIAWEDWTSVYVTVEATTLNGYGDCDIYINGDTDLILGWTNANYAEAVNDIHRWFCILLLPLHNGDRRALGYCFGMENDGSFMLDVAFDGITDIQVRLRNGSGGHFQAGSRYEVWGEK